MAELRVVAGLDIHSKFVTASVARKLPSGKESYETKRFECNHAGLSDLNAWLKSSSCELIALESTGKYWLPVHDMLEDVCQINVCNPKYLRAVKGQKTDPKDSRWIAKLALSKFAQNHSYILPKEQRDLRYFSRHVTKSTQHLTQIKNRIRNALRSNGITLEFVISTLFCPTSINLIRHVIETNGAIDRQYCTDIIHSSRCLIKKTDAIIDSISHSNFTPPGYLHLVHLIEQFDELRNSISEASKQLVQLGSTSFEGQIDLLLTAGYISRTSAVVILSEIGTNMKSFKNSRRFISWAGLAPGTDQSADKVKSSRIGKGGRYLKPLLVQIAWTAIRVDKGLRAKFANLKARIGAKKAIIAIARKILQYIYAMLKKNEPYHPHFPAFIFEKVEEGKSTESSGEITSDDSGSANKSDEKSQGREIASDDSGSAAESDEISLDFSTELIE